MQIAKKIKILFLAGLMVLSSAGCVNAAALGETEQETHAELPAEAEVPDTNAVIVHSDDTESAENVVASYGVEGTETVFDYQVITFSSDIDAAQAKTALANAGIDAVYDSSFEIQENDESFSEEQTDSAMPEAEEPETPAEEQIIESQPDVQESQEDVPEGEKTKVAVIDTGVSGIECQQINLTDSPDEDINGHGTKVAQTIIDSSEGKAEILSIKAMGDDGRGSMVTIMKAVQTARDNGADVINLSVSAYDDGSMQALKQVISDTVTAGIKVVSAAGNYNSSAMVYVPSNIEGVISVGAADENGNKTPKSNYGASYYEVADSTSSAAAVLSGKIAAGSDLSQEWTNKTVSFDRDSVNPSPFLEGGTTASYNEETDMHTIEHTVYINIAGEMYQHAYDIGAKYWIFSEKDISGALSRYTDNSYDRTYANNFWFYDSKEDFDADVEAGTKAKAEFTAGSIDENHFETQTLWGNTSGYLTAGIDYTGKGGGNAYMSLTRRCSYTMNRYWVWYGNQGGTEHYGGGNGTYESASGEKTLDRWTDGGKYGTISINGQIKAVYGGTGWNGTTIYHSTVSTSYNTGNVQAADPYLNVNLIGPDGGEKLDGSIGTFSYTYSNWGQSGQLNVADCFERKPSGTYYRIGQLNLKNGLVYTGTTVTDSTGTVSNVSVLGDGFVRQVSGNTTVNINTRYAKVGINPNGGTWNGSTAYVEKICTAPEGTLSVSAPLKTGARFTGWKLEGSGSLSGTTYKYGTGDAILTAQWEQSSTTYVNYDTNGGSKGTEISNPSGYKIIDDGVYSLQTKMASGRFIHVSSASTEKGASMCIWETAPSTALQTQWRFERAGNTPYYYIVSELSGFAMSIQGDGSAVTNSSKYVDLQEQKDGLNDENADYLWYLKDAGNDFVWICNKKTNRVLDAQGATDANGTQIIVWDNNGGDCQKWKMHATTTYKDSYGRRPLYSGSAVLTDSVPPVRKGYMFSGWNTAADGSGTMYMANLYSSSMNGTATACKLSYTGSDIYLYAQWVPLYENSTLNKTMTQYYNELNGDVQAKIKPQTVTHKIYDFYQPSAVEFTFKEGFTNPQTMNANLKISDTIEQQKVFAPGIDEIRMYLGDGWTSQSLNNMFFGTTDPVNRSAWLRDSRTWFGNTKAMTADGKTGGLHSYVETTSLEARPTYELTLTTKK